MKRFYSLFTALTILTVLLSNCTTADNLSYNTVVGRIEGKWTVKKVKLLDNGKLFRSDISDKYVGTTFDFKYDNTLEMFDPSKGITYFGSWFLDEVQTWDEDDQDYESSYRLYTMIYLSAELGDVREMRWNDVVVSNNRLEGIETTIADDGKNHKFRIELKK